MGGREATRNILGKTFEILGEKLTFADIHHCSLSKHVKFQFFAVNWGKVFKRRSLPARVIDFIGVGAGKNGRDNPVLPLFYS